MEEVAQCDAMELVQKCQTALSHAWMIRAFLRHCDEAEDYVELTDFSRDIFDLCRALDPHTGAPGVYFKTVQKKLAAFRSSVEKFAVDAPRISAHMNFVQAVESARACLKVLEENLQMASDCGFIVNRKPAPPV